MRLTYQHRLSYRIVGELEGGHLVVRRVGRRRRRGCVTECRRRTRSRRDHRSSHVGRIHVHIHGWLIAPPRPGSTLRISAPPARTIAASTKYCRRRRRLSTPTLLSYSSRTLSLPSAHHMIISALYYPLLPCCCHLPTEITHKLTLFTSGSGKQPLPDG